MQITYLSKGQTTLSRALLSLEAPYGDGAILSVNNVGRFKVTGNKLTEVTLSPNFVANGLFSYLDEVVAFELLWYDTDKQGRGKGMLIAVFLHGLLSSVSVSVV